MSQSSNPHKTYGCSDNANSVYAYGREGRHKVAYIGFPFIIFHIGGATARHREIFRGYELQVIRGIRSAFDRRYGHHVDVVGAIHTIRRERAVIVLKLTLWKSWRSIIRVL